MSTEKEWPEEVWLEDIGLEGDRIDSSRMAVAYLRKDQTLYHESERLRRYVPASSLTGLVEVLTLARAALRERGTGEQIRVKALHAVTTWNPSRATAFLLEEKDRRIAELEKRLVDEGFLKVEMRDRVDQAESRLQSLREALAEAVDFAEEGWGYASGYFREKWDFDGQLGKLRKALAKHQPTEKNGGI